MAEYVSLLSPLISVVALVVSFLSFALGRRDLRSAKREQATIYLTDAQQDLDEVSRRVPILKVYWGSVFALRGAPGSSRQELIHEECDGFLTSAESIGETLETKPAELERLGGKHLNRRVSQLYHAKTAASKLREEVQRSWDHCLSEMEQARKQ